jgi:hypothetical protein
VVVDAGGGEGGDVGAADGEPYAVGGLDAETVALPVPGRGSTHSRGRGDDLVIQSIEMTSLPRVPAANCSIASPVCSRL